MKTKIRALAVATVIIALTVGTTGPSLAFGGWPYPGHTMRPDLEDQKGDQKGKPCRCMSENCCTSAQKLSLQDVVFDKEKAEPGPTSAR